jgi:uncharacterized alpha/beta hydrolase family protein
MASIDQELVLPQLRNAAALANEYKLSLKQGENVFDMLIEELPVAKEKTCQYMKLFRVTKEISFDSLRDAFHMDP